jgi:glycosyltransferase involved in cell wall biosynthesis
MNIHTVMITHNRLEITKQALTSYMETVTGPWSLTVVDNGSTDGTREWLLKPADVDFLHRVSVILLQENKYPGYACNRGWEQAPPGTVLLHRADNDWRFLPDWETHVRLMFSVNERLGQLGMRTDQQELHNQHNVGGNCVIRKQLWDEGLRYDERPWPKIKRPGYTEDSYMSPRVTQMGWEWGRVGQECIESLADEDPTDEYYLKSWEDRGILEQAKKAYGIT